MEHRMELFKANGIVLSPRNHKSLNGKLQQANRAEKRKTIYNQTRNISPSPKFDDFKVKTTVSSTPMVKSHRTSKDYIKENSVSETITETLQIDKTVSETKTEKKLSRHEAHIQRFLAWKAEKLKQKELEKQKAKPPFVPVGKPKQNNIQTRQQSSFAPKNHVFRPPTGLKDPTLKEADEQSIYKPLHMPPRNRTSNDPKLINSQDSKDFKSKSVPNGVTIGPNIISTKSLTRNIPNKPLCNDTKKTLPTTSLESGAKIGNASNLKANNTGSLGNNCPTSATGSKSNVVNTAHGSISRNLLGVKRKEMLTPNTDTKEKLSVMPKSNVNSTASKTNIVLGQKHGNGFTKNSSENNSNKVLCLENNKILPKCEKANYTAGKTCTLVQKSQQLTSVRDAKFDSQSKESIRKISPGSRSYMPPNQNGMIASKPYCTANKEDLQNKNVPQSKPSTLKENTASHRFETGPNKVLSKPKDCVRPNLVKPTNGYTNRLTTAGAVGKAKAMHERKQNNLANSSKPKLALNLKAKKQNNCYKLTTAMATKIADNKFRKHLKETTDNMESGKTPSEGANSDKVFAFVTSTQMKPKSALSLSTLEFSELGTTISPVEPNTAVVPHFKTEQSVSAKRALLQEDPKEKKNRKNRKFNFIKKVTVDDTMLDSPGLPPTTIRQKESNIETEQEIQGISSASRKNENTSQTPRNLSMASRIIKKLQLEVLEKAPKLQSPGKSRLAGMRSSKGNINQSTEEIKRNSLNFELPVQENSTAQESVRTSPKQNIANEKVNDVSTPIAPSHQVTPTKEVENSERPINYLSPFVSVSRGKVSSRKEKEKRNSFYLQETPTKCQAPEQNFETPVEKRRALEAVRYFRQQLTDETQRLLELCDQWSTYKEEQMELLQANGGEDMINATIGQTRLLISKKFMQFSGLIDRCEAHSFGNDLTDDGSEATKTITPQDLEGFWSMLGLQVENIEKRVRNLERWKANRWEDPDAVVLKPRPKNKSIGTHKKITKPNCIAKPRENSALRQMMRKMMAEKRAKKDELTNTTQSEEIQILVKDHSPSYSPLHSRRSILKNETLRRNSFSNTPGRMNIIVPNRRSRSIARTIISVPSPGHYSSIGLKASKTALQHELTNLQELTENNNLLKTALIGRSRRSSSKTPLTETNSPLRIKNVPTNSNPSTPTTTVQNVRKSILKTPGTGKSRLRNVVFNEHLSVKKFRSLSYDESDQSMERESIQQIHINDFHNIRKSTSDITPSRSTGSKSDERTYCLRNRKVKLRPSCEIEIPK